VITVALDAMGGDYGPSYTVPAVVQALLHFPELNIQLVGRESDINAELDAQTSILPRSIDRDALLSRLTIHHCDHVIANDAKPSAALRNSRGSSMRETIDLVARGDADAAVSGGNTGALMALSKHGIKMLPGIERPALVSALPTQSGQPVWLLDLGANIDVDSDTLYQFAIMGSALAEQHLAKVPKVALLNIGAEASKGNDTIKSCAMRLEQTHSINYIGFIEGHEILLDKADVIVCDGFAGNICLKTSEGIANLILNKLKQHFFGHPVKKWLARILFASALKELKALNPDQYNGASLLGLRSIVIKSHGSADKTAIINAIGEAVHEVKRQIPQRISDGLETVLLERH
jgi:glycerol-3-phosphate acyltransferase PlsX